MFTIIILTLICSIIYQLYQHFFPSPNINPNGKYVLISGCDTGIGCGLALELDKQGFNVLAGVFTENSVISLKNELSPKAAVFRLDITKQEDIDAAFELVKEKTKVLHALVNNAGIATGGNIDWTSMELMRKIMNVNFFGHVAMTKKFLPLLIAKRNSRVVNVSSMSGFISLPGSSAYCTSKYALESFSDCLRREMNPWGLHVCIIEPGTMRTSMTEGIEHQLRNIWLQSPIEVQERWGEEFFHNSLKVVINSPFIRYSESPEKVIRVLEHAIMSTNPRIRYRPGWQSSLFFYPLSTLPVWLVDKLFSLASSVHPAGVKHQLQ
jgi:NAD(P)-dependent dehydrogenase (short-subunit alcohol dehydrogenase family)